uniref:DNA polymerase III subunit beta n=1 Tax=Oceanobacillus massiliensis TaxID=1465765 RepID=UPI003019DF16
MKFQINRELFVEGLNKVAKVVSSKDVMPVLTGILVEVKEDEIMLTGTNVTETISHCIPVDGESVVVIESGKTVFPRQVVDIVKKLKKQVSFHFDGQGHTTIQSGKSTFQLNCLDAEEYPQIPKVDMKNPTIVFEGIQFRDYVKRTAFAASENEARPILQGVLYDIIADEKLNLVCTDSHRLARIKHTVSNSVDARIVVPAKALDNAIKIFDLSREVHTFVNDSQLVFFRNGQKIYSTRLFEGNYPDTSRLIPGDYSSTMTINRKEFINALELIGGIANSAENTTRGIAKLHVNGVASLSSYQAQTGKGEVQIPYESL